MTLDRKAIRETLAGYARTSEFTEAERRERLRNMTAEESLAIYEDLVETWAAMRSSEAWRCSSGASRDSRRIST